MSTATDIITYVGVPLAVLGVLPILYNTTVTLAALSRIRRMLSRSHTTATSLTRSDVVNRVIELELPRYAIAPLARAGPDSDGYWSLSDRPSSLPGGSWTTFNWRARVVGFRTQRVEYADQVRQPQGDVGLDDLVSYLLDLGAVPDPVGWRLLRTTGLWTPAGCALMLAPDRVRRALTVAPLDDSDGCLSLSVTWKPEWTTRDRSALPPYWMRLPGGGGPSPSLACAESFLSPGDTKRQKEEGEGELVSETSRYSNMDVNIACHISVVGLVDAAVESSILTFASESASASAAASVAASASLPAPSVPATSTSVPESAPESRFTSESRETASPLYIDHLRITPHSRRDDGIWFASAATAYGAGSDTVLWSYRIPDHVLAFSRRESLPCGVLVILGLVDGAATPEWETRHDNDAQEDLDRFVRRTRDQRMAVEAEARMTPADRAWAQQDRMRRENQDRLDEARDRLRVHKQRIETRTMEALQSPKWTPATVAPHALRWLLTNGHLSSVPCEPTDPEPTKTTTTTTTTSSVTTVREAVGEILHRMVFDPDFSARLARTLDLWKAWADNGGMRRSDMDALASEGRGGGKATAAAATLAQAVLFPALIADATAAGGAGEGSLSSDLRECLDMWKRVRLG